jgi:pimeloyl-ACP methyl ester carboxylesterase
MVAGLTSNFVTNALGLITRFIPEQQYREKVEHVLPMDEKNKGFDLGPWTYRRLRSGGGAYHHRYYELPSKRPSAPTLLLLHGLSLDGRTFLGFKELSDHFHLVAYDYPEHWNRYRGGLDDFVVLIDDFLQVKNLQEVVLAGVSLGGIVALRYAAQRPRKVRALGLIASQIAGYDARMRARARSIHTLTQHLPDHKVYWLNEMVSQHYLRGLPPSIRQQVTPLVRPKQISFMRQAAASINNYDGRRDAAALTCPVIVLTGTNDELIPQRSVDHFRRAVAHAKIVTIPEGRHVVAVSHATLVTRHLTEFLRTSGLVPNHD